MMHDINERDKSKEDTSLDTLSESQKNLLTKFFKSRPDMGSGSLLPSAYSPQQQPVQAQSEDRSPITGLSLVLPSVSSAQSTDDLLCSPTTTSSTEKMARIIEPDHDSHKRSASGRRSRFHHSSTSSATPGSAKAFNRTKSTNTPSNARAKALWGNLRAAREAAAEIEYDVTPVSQKKSEAGFLSRDFSDTKPSNDSDMDDPKTKIMNMAKLLKQKQVDRQANEVTTFFKDVLGNDPKVKNNKMYSMLWANGWLRKSRVNQTIDPESTGMLATHDSTFIRYLFFAIMLNYGMFAKILSMLPANGNEGVTTVSMIIAVSEFFGCLMGGFFGDIVGRRLAVNKGAALMVAGSGFAAFEIWKTPPLWTQNTVISYDDWISIWLFIAAAGAVLMLPPGMVLVSESTSHINREFILCIGFLFQAIGGTICEFAFYIISSFDLTDNGYYDRSGDGISKSTFGNLRNDSHIKPKISGDYTNIWPLIAIGLTIVFITGIVIISLSYWHPLHQESYIWKNKSLWLCDINEEELKTLVEQAHTQNSRRREMSCHRHGKLSGSLTDIDDETPRLEGSMQEVGLPKDISLTRIDTQSNDDSETSPVSNVQNLSEPLLKSAHNPQRISFGASSQFVSSHSQESDSYEVVASEEPCENRSVVGRIARGFRYVHQRLFRIIRMISTYYHGLYEYALGSGSTVRNEILTLMFIPFLLFVVSFSTSKYTDLFLNLQIFHKNMFPVKYFHYQFMLSILSIPAFLLSSTILIYYTPKFLQLVSLVCSAFIYSGLALSLFGIDNQVKNASGKIIHLEDFYYSAMAYDAIFQFGLYIPMVTCFIMPIEGTHTRVRATILSFAMASSRIGILSGIFTADQAFTKHNVNRVMVLLIVCVTCLVMAFLSKANIPSQYVSRYDMPELHTIDLVLDKRFPERKNVLLKEIENQRNAKTGAITGLYTLTTHSMAARLQ